MAEHILLVAHLSFWKVLSHFNHFLWVMLHFIENYFACYNKLSLKITNLHSYFFIPLVESWARFCTQSPFIILSATISPATTQFAQWPYKICIANGQICKCLPIQILPKKMNAYANIRQSKYWFDWINWQIYLPVYFWQNVVCLLLSVEGLPLD